MTSSNPLSTSSPGLGYVVLGCAQTAKFKALGSHFIISFLPSSFDDNCDPAKLNICLWLGEGRRCTLIVNSTADDATELIQQDILVYVLWPGKGVLTVDGR